MTDALSKLSIVALKDGLVSAEIDGEIVLMNIASGDYVAVGGPGVPAMELLIKSPRPLGELYDRVREIYEVDEAVLINEISQFVTRICDVGLAEIRPPA